MKRDIELENRKMDEFMAKESSQPLPMPDGSTRIFTMTNWHWWALELAEEHLYFTPKRTVESMMTWDWDVDLDTKLMGYIQIAHEEHTRPKLLAEREKQKSGADGNDHWPPFGGS